MRASAPLFAIACAALSAGAAAAQDDGHDACLLLSFAPLDVNIPACTALIETGDVLAPETLSAAYAARAEAYVFARTYHGDHVIDDAALIGLAIDDLTAALDATTAPDDVERFTLRRAELHGMIGDDDAARADYETILANDPEHAAARAGVAWLSDRGD